MTCTLCTPNAPYQPAAPLPSPKPPPPAPGRCLRLRLRARVLCRRLCGLLRQLSRRRFLHLPPVPVLHLLFKLRELAVTRRLLRRVALNLFGHFNLGRGPPPTRRRHPDRAVAPSGFGVHGSVSVEVLIGPDPVQIRQRDNCRDAVSVPRHDHRVGVRRHPLICST